MRLAYVAGLSWPGNPEKPNDDAFCHGDAIAAVFDGATSLGEPLLPVDSDAAWIARKGAAGLLAHQNLSPREALARTAEDAERAYVEQRSRPPRENYELPLASMMMTGFVGAALEFLWFGDCTALIANPGEKVQIVGDALDKKGGEAAMASRLAAKHNLAPAAGVNLPQFLDALRKGRNTVNTAPDRWAFTPDARCAAFAKSKTIPAEEGATILLCSDGFLALTSDYGKYDAQSLFDASLSRGLKAMFEELRAIERDDPEGRKFPRFKTSDDATALIVRVT
jgi:serine/threonine protein phosphatase PrpC